MSLDNETKYGSKAWMDSFTVTQGEDESFGYGINLYDVLVSSKSRIIETIIRMGREHIGFSKSAYTFAEWAAGYKGDKRKKYYQRIKGAAERGAETLEEARGKKVELREVKRETITEVTPEWKNWDKDRYQAFYDLRMFMIEQLRNSWKSDIDDIIELADELSSDEDMQGETVSLSWDMIDIDGEIVYFWIYKDGEITDSHMWNSFSYSRLRNRIKKSGIW